MTTRYDNTDEFRGASFTGATFAAAKFRDCDLRQVKIVDSLVVDVSVSGDVRNFLVNDVDVTPFVEAELDRRHPERATSELTANGPLPRRFATWSSPPTPGQAGRSSTSRCRSTGSVSPIPVIRPRTRRHSA